MVRWVIPVVAMLIAPATAQWVEVNEAGEPVSGQWQAVTLSTPLGTFNGWQTTTRRERPHFLARWFTPTRQVVEVTFAVKTPPKGRRGLTFGLSYGAPTHWANEGVRVAFGGNGVLMRHDVGDWFTWRSRFAWLPVAEFAFSQWLTVRLVADPTIGAFRVWLDDRASDLQPFLSPVPQLNCFFLFNGEGDGAAIEVSEPNMRIGALPNAPKSLQVVPISSDRLQLRWQPSETPNIRAYRIYRRGQLAGETNQTVWTDTKERADEAYSYFVTAVAATAPSGGATHREPPSPRSEVVESLPSWQDAAMPQPKRAPVVRRHPPVARYDIVVVGATPAGIAAAISAARLGHKTALVERTNHIGGMMTGGLSATDRRYRQASGGLFAEFLRRVDRFYAQAYGENSPQHRACRDGYLFEPKVALQVFWHMLAEAPNLHLYLRHELVGVVAGKPSDIRAVLLLDKNRSVRWRMDGRIFIDATYEGDLAAMAGVPYRVGREGRHEFGEEHAGEVFWDSRDRQITFGRPDGDKKVQAYNYRLNLTKRADNRRLIAAPPDYAPHLYEEIVERVKEGVLWHPMEVVSLVKLPQQKFDANNTPGPFPSTDFIGANYEYPEADWNKREQIARKHRNYIVGLLYFLQTDQRLPNAFRVAAQHWCFAADEFVDNDNFPPQLYVREARRIVGEYVFTEHDARPTFPGRRAPVHEDSIAVAEYPIDSHATTPRDPKRPYLHEGFFYLPQITAASCVPYRVMLPIGHIENLLVCGAVSATHIGFGTLRLEPVWMALGQAAGTAAHLALTQNPTRPSVRSVPVDQLQRLLLQQGQVIAFFTDLPPTDTDEFAAVQFFAARGFFDTYEARAGEAVDKSAARKMLHRFAELIRRPIPHAFGTAYEHPTQDDVVRWLASLLQRSPNELRAWLDITVKDRDAPLTRGQLCVWLYRLWGRLR
ncbi:Putative thiazole biosynthetic enzyme [bacterium HR17]|uniref:Thiazole biosynthetic enzyme n=1 Tax=Candidatus Fervidibacter japonicus TaxID=2035412 RepID=A0A2H5XEC8_9BACT|nr:Putative thiazole biosynthetic enzyme [bacterium HR17]